MVTPIVDLFIVTYGADAEWLWYCLRSARKNLTGIRDIVVGCPTNIISIEEACRKHNARLFQFEHRDPGHMQHMVYIMRADQFVRPGCDWICFMDADCVFPKPVSALDQFRAGKPIFCYDTWEKDHTYQWRRGTERFLGRSVPLNFMRRIGMMFRPGHLQTIRAKVEQMHNDKPFDDLIMGCWDSTQEWFPARGPEKRLWQPFGKPTLSEFCMMGDMLWRECPQDYCWWDVSCFGWPGGEQYSFFKQYWSHWDVTPKIRAELEVICNGV